MGDAIRPSDDEFDRVLRKSIRQWSSYLDLAKGSPLFPPNSLDLKSLLGQTPRFLGQGTLSSNMSFVCEEQALQGGKNRLLINGQSVWRTSKGNCTLEPKVLRKQLVLAVQSPMRVEFTKICFSPDRYCLDGSFLSDDEKYITVLFLAWAYILSAQWAELLNHSSENPCRVEFMQNSLGNPHGSSTGSNRQATVEIDVGNDIDEAEAFWWNAILCSDGGWNISCLYNHNVYFSPWSVSSCDSSGFAVTRKSSIAKAKLPSSAIALEYVSRFCLRHGLYNQSSASLAAALYIPYLSGRLLSLPLSTYNLQFLPAQCGASIPALFEEYKDLLPYYMTLSSNTWGIRSLLYCTFFNSDIECNLVSPWLNPAFAIVDTILKENDFAKLATFLTIPDPRLGPLWLGAILTGLAKSFIRDIRAGFTALDLHAAGWTGTTQTFLTYKTGVNDGESIRREDECRLLFLTACDDYTSVPIGPWKPFGETLLCNTEIKVRTHAQCGSHCLEYESWDWLVTNGDPISDSGLNKHRVSVKAPPENCQVDASTKLWDFNYDCSSQFLSEMATRGIFGWLRSTGYPMNEKPLYQHSWIDIESSDEELDDKDSDSIVMTRPKRERVESWLDNLE